MNARATTSGDWSERCEAVVSRLSELRLLPVAELPEESVAAPLADALVAGGLPCLEVTLRTAAAEGGLRAARQVQPELLLAAGTVLSPDDVELAVRCGADFAVSPGISRAVVEAARERGLPIVPGVCTPSEVQLAIELGIGTVKFFPAEASGGVATLRALRGPFTTMRFVPTGGISADALESYLRVDGVVACGGSWLVARELLAARDFGQVEALARDAVRRVTDAR